MKVVFIPGVGDQKDNSKYEKFLKSIQKEVDFDWEVFNWSHSHIEDDYDKEQGKSLQYKSLRSWLAERILDFQHVLLHADKIKVPEADIYFGHSAGSILALSNSKKKCVIFGSLLRLIEIESVSNKDLIATYRSKNLDLLNIIHKKDVLSYPLKGYNIENFVINNKIFDLFGYSPMRAHDAYWASEDVKKKVCEMLKIWSE